MSISSYLSAFRHSGLPLRTSLVALVAIILIPALILGGWLTLRWGNAERALLEANAEAKARQVAIDIDSDIAAAKAALIALSDSRFLQKDDFENLRLQFANVARPLGAQFVLRDAATGVQLVNSAFPWGEALPTEIPPQVLNAMQEAIRTGGPTVSNVFFSAALKKFIVNLGLPILRQGGVKYFLSIGIPVQFFADSLQSAALPPSWIVSLVDSDDTIVARSDQHDELIGRKVILNGELLARAKREGVVVNVNRFGVLYRSVLHRSEATGWSVFVGLPISELNAPARSALLIYGGASAALLVFAIGIAFIFGERLAQSFGEMGVSRSPTREEFRILFESASNGVLVVDAEGTVVLANEEIERQFGYARSELIGQAVEVLLPERLRHDHVPLRRTFAAAPASRAMGAGKQLFGRRKDGSEFPIEISLNPIATRSGQFVMATIVDITRRLQSEQQLLAAIGERNDLRRRHTRAQEVERLRLARELHDQTGQNLTAVLLELKDLESQLKDDGRHRARALRKNMEEIGKTLHRIAWELRPASIDELGLTSALADYVSQWGRQYGVEVDFHCREPELDLIADDKRTAIYRIVQEALTNVAKHAQGATSVSVVVDRSGAILQLTIEDNGHGMGSAANTSADESRKRLGLVGVRERLALVGGELEIESSGAGTALFARIPVEKEKEPA